MFIGDTAKAPRKEYRFDEILIEMDGGNLILAGHPKRGCLYAVYSFLQDCVGVRWWTPEDAFIPKKPTLVVADDLLVSYAPELISREMYHRNAQPTVFSARMKGNGSLTPEYGGAVRIINFVHSFYKYLPPDKYFDAHPDWYSEIDGKRKHEGGQLCLTNEEMTMELVKQVLEALRSNPDAKIIDVSQNDWHGGTAPETASVRKRALSFSQRISSSAQASGFRLGTSLMRPAASRCNTCCAKCDTTGSTGLNQRSTRHSCIPCEP